MNATKQKQIQTDGSEAKSTEKFTTKSAIAKMIKQTERSIENHMREGLPYFKIGRSVRFREADVLAWLEKTCKVN